MAKATQAHSHTERAYRARTLIAKAMDLLTQTVSATDLLLMAEMSPIATDPISPIANTTQKAAQLCRWR